MTTKTFNIDSLLQWSEPKTVSTRAGDRILRTAEPTDEFWALWKLNKEELKRAGIQINNFRNKWTVNLWSRPSVEEVQEKVDALDQSFAIDSKIKIPSPRGLTYMGFQKAGIEFSSQRYSTLIGDEMGLGKTIQAIGFINLMKPKKILIVCPATLKINWMKELNKWLVDKYRISIGKSKKLLLADITIINYDIIHKHIAYLSSIHFDLIVGDEIHYIKNPEAKRTKEMHKLSATYRIAMSGTPMLNRPIEMFSPLNWLDKEAWPDYYRFAARYCGAKTTRFGFDARGSSNLSELQERLRTTIMIRRLKSQVLPQLPPKTRQLITIEQDYELGKLVQREQEILTQAYSGELQGSAELIFEMLAKIRHMQALAKLPYVYEHIDGIMDEDPRKLVVFAYHQDVVDGIYQHCKSKGWHPTYITGRIKMEDRDRAVTKFQENPECMVFIGNFKAAGVGLTLTASSHAIFVEEDWTPGNITQAEDRIHRMGQKDNCLIQHLVVDGSLDAEMTLRMIAKQNVIDKALDTGLEKKVVEEFDPVKEILLVQPEDAVTFTEDEKLVYHQWVKEIASYDRDFARTLNGVGFNKVDSHIGHVIADLPLGELTDRLAGIAKRLATKYRGQLAIFNQEEE